MVAVALFTSKTIASLAASAHRVMRLHMLLHPSGALFIAYALGIALAEFASLPAAFGLWGMVGSLSLMLWAVRARHGVVLCALALAIATGAWSVRTHVQPGAVEVCGSDNLWEVRITGPVGRLHDAATGLRRMVVVELLQERCGAMWYSRQGRVRLKLRDGVPVYRGDTLFVQLQVSPLAAARNPGDLSLEARGRRQGFAAQAVVRSDHVLVVPGHGFWTWLDKRREGAAEAFEANLPPSLAPLAEALALGDQTGIAPAQRDAWADSGMTHLLSVSGLHVTLVAVVLGWLAAFLLGWLPGAGERYNIRRCAAVVTLPGVLGYCALSGAPPAAVRAAIMAATAVLGMALGSPSAAANAWGVAGLLMLVVDPMALYDVGFLLSFTAVAALIWGIPRLGPLPASASRWRRVGQWAVLSVVTSFAATWLTAPLTAYFFARVGVVAPWVNLLAVPWASGLATPLALLHVLGAALSPPLGTLVAWPLQWCLQGLDGMALGVARWRYASVDMPPFGPVEWVAFICSLLVLAPQTPRYWRWRGAGCAVAVLAVGFAWRWHGRQQTRDLVVHHLYVGQGDSTLVVFPQGRTLLVDGGGAVLSGEADPGRLQVVPSLRRLGIRRLDAVLLTHPHPDHLAGLAAVTQRLPVGEFWHNGMGQNYPLLTQVMQQVQQGGGVVRRIDQLPTHHFWQGVSLELLHLSPPQGGPFDPAYSLNDNSVVLRLRYGQRSIVLAGDVEGAAEARLLPFLQGPIDLLKVPHHGSRTSSGALWVQHLKPRLAVISCGDRNRFGFPHPEVMQRYDASGSKVLRSDEDGMVTYRTDGRAWRLDTARGSHFHGAS